MSFMDSIIGGLKLDSEGFDEEEYLDEADTPDVVERVPSKPDTTDEVKKAPVFAPRSAPKSRKLGNGMEVCVIKPTSFDESQIISTSLCPSTNKSFGSPSKFLNIT